MLLHALLYIGAAGLILVHVGIPRAVGALPVPLVQSHRTADLDVHEHPRLFFSARDLPYLRQKQFASPFMKGVLLQYEAALTHRLNYSAGGTTQDVGTGSAKGIDDNDGRGTRHQLAASLYVMGYGNET